jgi:hypothetical protein
VNDGFSWWLVVLGIAVGIGLVWLFTVRLPVSESDIDEEETVEEAGWISETIESWGGVAPAPLVQEVLELHKRYLDGDRSGAMPNDVEPDAEVDAAYAPPPEQGHSADHPVADHPAADLHPASYPPSAPPAPTGLPEIPPPPMPRAGAE